MPIVVGVLVALVVFQAMGLYALVKFGKAGAFGQYTAQVVKLQGMLTTVSAALHQEQRARLENRLPPVNPEIQRIIDHINEQRQSA